MQNPQNTLNLNTLRKNPLIVYLAVFGFLAMLFYAFYTSTWYFKNIIEPVSAFYAKTGNTILNILGFDTLHNETSIISEQLTLNVFTGCDGTEAMALFASAIIALGVSWTTKFKGLLFGLPLLVLINIIRVVSLFILGIFLPSLFDFFHVQFWQIAYILSAMLIWLYWANKTIFKQIPSSNNA